MLTGLITYLRRRPALRFNVVGLCPTTHVQVPTHAYMTPAQLKRFDRTLALFCPACRTAHQFTAADLSLDPHTSRRD